MWIGRAAVAAILTFGAAAADAQITTVIAPTRRAEAKQVEAARRAEVARDSVARVTLTDMTKWVDSAAAALALRPDTGTVPATDTARSTVPAEPGRSADSAAAVRGRPVAPAREFRDGARAPDTATSLPALALAGGAMLVLGMLLRRRENRHAVARVRRHR
jgi:hypothetical protein